MSNQPTPTPPLLPPPTPSRPLLPPPRHPRLVKVRAWLSAWLRSRAGRIVVPSVAFVLGIAIGILALLLYGLSGQGSVLPVPAGSGNIIVEADRTFLTELVRENISQSGMPGTIQNVSVDLARGDQLTVNGDDAFSLVGFGVSKHFDFVVQPYIASCVVQIHIVQADLSGIPVTGFVSAFESSINQQLTEQPSGLPKGFNYCASGVRTQPDGMFVTYTATPVSLGGAHSRRFYA